MSDSNFVIKRKKLISDYYLQTVDDEHQIVDVLACLLDIKMNSCESIINNHLKDVSNHVRILEYKKRYKKILKYIVLNDWFYINLPSDSTHNLIHISDALNILESAIYLDTVLDESVSGWGKRIDFLGVFKSLDVKWAIVAVEMIVWKGLGNNPRELLSLYKGTKDFSVQLVDKFSSTSLIESFVNIIIPSRKGILFNENYIGRTFQKEYLDTEEILDCILDEMYKISNYFLNESGDYWNIYETIEATTKIPELKKQEKKFVKKVHVSNMSRALKVLRLKKPPENLKELKKAYHRLAQSYHPDKFSGEEKGTNTELRILSRFRSINLAYEYLLKKTNKK